MSEVPQQEVHPEVAAVHAALQDLIPDLISLGWNRRQYELFIDVLRSSLGLKGPSTEELLSLRDKDQVEEHEPIVEEHPWGTVTDRRRPYV